MSGMKIRIGEFEFTECWDGILYKKLSRYPEISPWEIQNILDFESYEAANGRNCVLEAEDSIRSAVEDQRAGYLSGRRLPPPPKITECTACPKYRGCMTDMVCHTSSAEDAVRILDCGSLLSAVRARKKSASELAAEKRNAAGDPEDYFDYVMFAWGNCQAGDRLVMERRLGRAPDESELGADFVPGVRFFFAYKDIITHPEAVFDGVLPLKIKNEVVLKDWVHTIVIPGEYREMTEGHIPDYLINRVFYLQKGGSDIWNWSERAYEYAVGRGVL